MSWKSTSRAATRFDAVWVDTYIHEHSQADISHSVCPDSMTIHNDISD